MAKKVKDSKKGNGLKAALVSLGAVSSQWTGEAMKSYFDVVDEIDLRTVEVHFSGKKAVVMVSNRPMKDYDCVYLKGSFRYANILCAISNILEKQCYMPLSSEAFTVVHDKLLTQLVLARHGIPTPKTWLNPTPESARKLLENANYPLIMKFPQGTQGKGVMFAESYAAASSILDVLSSLNQPFIIQEYIETGSSDLRLIVIGDKVVAGMKRTASIKEKRANIHAGGRADPFEPDEYLKKIAVDTAKVLGCEICGVDVLLSGARGPLVIEANISPGLQGIQKVTKGSIADKIAAHLYKRAYDMKNKSIEKGSKNILAEINGEPAHCQEIISSLDFRGTRILLPEIVTKMAKFSQHEDYQICFEKDKIVIKRFNID
ncbi:MAG: RimK family alpha-L-glutamate ligase [Nanoarchaeota archaeon]|nr:RimK family alpha-L-glutamate ligase [Nanoarchaeota archaeon]